MENLHAPRKNSSGRFAIWGRLVTDEEGATMVEYALMLAFIALVCFAAVGTLGTTVSTKMQPVATAVGSGT